MKMFSLNIWSYCLKHFLRGPLAPFCWMTPSKTKKIGVLFIFCHVPLQGIYYIGNSRQNLLWFSEHHNRSCKILTLNGFTRPLLLDATRAVSEERKQNVKMCALTHISKSLRQCAHFRGVERHFNKPCEGYAVCAQLFLVIRNATQDQQLKIQTQRKTQYFLHSQIRFHSYYSCSRVGRLQEVTFCPCLPTLTALAQDYFSLCLASNKCACGK